MRRRRRKAPGEGPAARTRPSPALAGCVPRGQPGVLCRAPGPRPDLRVESDERWEEKGLSYPGTELPADHSPEPPRGHRGPRPARPETAWAGGLPPSGVPCCGHRKGRLRALPTPTFPPQSSSGTVAAPAGQKPLWIPRPLPARGAPPGGQMPPALAPPTSPISHVRGVGQTPSLPAKPWESHRAGLWGCPSGSNPQRHPSRGQLIR